MARLKFSLKQKKYYLTYKKQTYTGYCLEDFPVDVVNEIREKFVLTDKTLSMAESKARGDLRKKHGTKPFKRGCKGWSKPGYKLQPKRKNSFQKYVSEEAYNRAVNNLEWCIKMKEKGYNSLPDWLECKRVICEYTGTHYEESVEKRNYYSL